VIFLNILGSSSGNKIQINI